MKMYKILYLFVIVVFLCIDNVFSEEYRCRVDMNKLDSLVVVGSSKASSLLKEVIRRLG